MKKRTVITISCMTLIIIVMLFASLVSYASANFELHKSAPKVSVISLVMNGVYEQQTIPLNLRIELNSRAFIYYEKIMWIQYSLDGQPGVNLTVKNEFDSYGPGYVISAAKTFADLTDGVHSLSIYGQTILSDNSDKSSNKPLSNFSLTNCFTIGDVTPTIHVLSPQPKTYDSTSMLLEFQSDKPLSWVGFSLDNNQAITSLATLSLNSLLHGPHSIRMYGNDSEGRLYTSQTVDFTVKDHDAPIIRIDVNATSPSVVQHLQPESFNWTSLHIVFEVNEPTPWIGYSLDGNTNKTIFGNFSISRLFYGSHNIIIYAKDNGGNIGMSEVFNFNLDKEGISVAKPSSNDPQQPMSTFTIAVAGTFTVICVGSVIYIKKRGQNKL